MVTRRFLVLAGGENDGPSRNEVGLEEGFESGLEGGKERLINRVTEQELKTCTRLTRIPWEVEGGKREESEGARDVDSFWRLTIRPDLSSTEPRPQMKVPSSKHELRAGDQRQGSVYGK